MPETVQSALLNASLVARDSLLTRATNGVRYASLGDNSLSAPDLERIVEAVPVAVAGALGGWAYHFVPLAIGERSSLSDSAGPETSAEDTRPRETFIALEYTPDLGDQAVCHRNVRLDQLDHVFISTRLLGDRFALAFEFFINIGHAFVDTAGVPQGFADLVWAQARADVRGETSQDAWESRALALPASQPATRSFTRAAQSSKDLAANRDSVGDAARDPDRAVDEKARNEFLEAAFSDAIAIYQLSLALDFDYAELREREYPLLAPPALAERLRLIAALFPPNPGYEFAIRYRRRP